MRAGRAVLAILAGRYATGALRATATAVVTPARCPRHHKAAGESHQVVLDELCSGVDCTPDGIPGIAAISAIAPVAAVSAVAAFAITIPAVAARAAVAAVATVLTAPACSGGGVGETGVGDLE